MAQSDIIQKDLGLVTAYGYALAGGYQGTEEQFKVDFAALMSGQYAALGNKPSINGVTLIGNKSSEDLNIQSGSEIDFTHVFANDLFETIDTNRVDSFTSSLAYADIGNDTYLVEFSCVVALKSVPFTGSEVYRLLSTTTNYKPLSFLISATPDYERVYPYYYDDIIPAMSMSLFKDGTFRFAPSRTFTAGTNSIISINTSLYTRTYS